MVTKTKDASRTIAVESAQECVGENNKFGSLNKGNCDIGIDNINKDV